MPNKKKVDCEGCPLADQIVDQDASFPLVLCQAFQGKGYIDAPRRACWYKRQATARSDLELVHGIEPHPWAITSDPAPRQPYLVALYNAAG
jgi:hypothetical protein